MRLRRKKNWRIAIPLKRSSVASRKSGMVKPRATRFPPSRRTVMLASAFQITRNRARRSGHGSPMISAGLKDLLAELATIWDLPGAVRLYPVAPNCQCDWFTQAWMVANLPKTGKMLARSHENSPLLPGLLDERCRSSGTEVRKDPKTWPRDTNSRACDYLSDFGPVTLAINCAGHSPFPWFAGDEFIAIVHVKLGEVRARSREPRVSGHACALPRQSSIALWKIRSRLRNSYSPGPPRKRSV